MSLDNFSIVPLKDVVKRVKVGFVGSCNKDYCSPDEGVPMIRTTNLSKEGIKLENLKYISKEFHKKNSKSQINFGDILIARHGHNGLASLWEHNFEAQCLNVVIVETDDSLADKHYLTYLINSSIIQNQIKSLTGGSVQSVVNTKDIADLEIPLPSLKKQREISSFISLFDKKIKVNKTLNKNLEHYLFNIFNEYFLDFDFNEFSNSNKKIPDSWSLGNFNDIINSLGSGDWGKEELTGNYTSEVYCIRGADIPDVKYGNKGKMPIRFILPKNYENRKLTENSIVIEISGGSPTQSTGRTVFISEKFLNRFDKDIICTNFCKVIKPKQNYEIFLYLYLNYLYDKDVMFAYENGTTGIKNFDIKSFIKNFLIVIPSKEDVVNFNKLVESIFDIIMHNGLEIEKLGNLRDTLLPKLMSGEIDISKVNCDLKILLKKFILIISNKRWLSMKTKIISKIQEQMKPFLNQGQYIKLTNSLLNSLKDIEILDNNNELSEIDNFKLLDSFLSAKQVEGRSDKTITYYKSTIEKLLSKINKQIYNFTTDDIRKYLFNYKEDKKSSKITIDNMRRIFSSFFSWLEDEDYILKNPVRRIHRVKTGRVVKEVLTDENLEVLRDNCNEIRDLAMVELLISTGIRVGELVRLNIEDINFYERECVVFGKGESERIVYFDARTKLHLMEYLRLRTDTNSALFVSLNNPFNRLGISGVETRLRELGKKCKIPKVHPHKFRRTMATNAIDKGMPIEQVQKLLGHVQIDTTMQYAMVNQSNVKMAHRKFIG